jgi:hypothetical protein
MTLIPISSEEILKFLDTLQDSQVGGTIELFHSICKNKVYLDRIWFNNTNGVTKRQCIDMHCNCDPQNSLNSTYITLSLDNILETDLNRFLQEEKETVYRWVWKEDGPKCYSTWVEIEPDEPKRGLGIIRPADKYDWQLLCNYEHVHFKLIHNSCKSEVECINRKYSQGAIAYSAGDVVQFQCRCTKNFYSFPINKTTDQVLINFWASDYTYKED